MNHGVCPKCHVSEVYCSLSADGEGLAAGSYLALIELMAGKSQATLWLNTYVCRACGYVEVHVANRDELALLPQAEGWALVTVTRS
jgi:hypothetical protein